MSTQDTDAADTLRMTAFNFTAEEAFDEQVTTPYAGKARRAGHLRRRIRETRETIAGLAAALAAGWDVGPELMHEQQRLAVLTSAS